MQYHYGRRHVLFVNVNHKKVRLKLSISSYLQRLRPRAALSFHITIVNIAGTSLIHDPNPMDILHRRSRRDKELGFVRSSIAGGAGGGGLMGLKHTLGFGGGSREIPKIRGFSH